MVGQRFVAVLAQQFGRAFHLAPRQRVDDAGLAAALFHEGEQLRVGVGLGAYRIADVRAVEAADELRRLVQR